MPGSNFINCIKLLPVNNTSIILLLLMSLSFFSCRTIKSYAVRGEFRYYNRIDDTIRVYLKQGLNKAFEYHIVPGKDSLVLFTTGETDMEKPADPKGYLPAICSDTTTIRFNDSLCYSEYNKTGSLLHNISSYSYYRKGDRDYLFYFNIDSTLLKRANKCQ